MAEKKDDKPKTTVKPTASAKPAAKPAVAKPVAKTTPAAKPAAAKPVAKTTRAAKPAAAKPAAKTAPAAKPVAAKPVAAKSAAETAKSIASNPVVKSKSAVRTSPTVKPVAAKPAPKPAAKSAAETAKAIAAKPEVKKKSYINPAPSKPAAKPAPKAAPAKTRKAEPAKKSVGKVFASMPRKTRIIIISAVAAVLVLALILGIVLGVSSCGGSGETYTNPYRATTMVGYSARKKGTVERVKPVSETKDGGLPSGYPKYGYTLGGVLGTADDKVAARDALINESDYYCALGTRNNSGNGNNGDGTYVWMDKDGYLYNGSVSAPVRALEADGSHRQLYKHTASVGMYYGDVSDDEPAIIKDVTLRPRGYGSYSVTGLYAPAGEVIKIQISEEDMNASGGVTIHIGQALYNGQSNNIWTAKNQMQRFPNILNTMNVNKNTATLENGVYTAYVGSFIGGPLYVRNTSTTVHLTISGGVAYSHFILGYTTPEEFAENAKSSAPYFDLEVWNFGVLHSGPKLFAKNFTYDDLYKVAVLWEKVSSVSTTNSNQGIVFLYDPFVAAGAAVAFPGRSSVNCPAGWMGGSLNYNAIVKSGSWGNFHEYHHNFQNYGVGNGGEVTNNAMTLVSYSLFTKISALRGIGSYGAAGLGGWNSYTSASWALNDLLSIQRGGNPSNGKQGLALYATLLHNFGPDNFIQSKVKQQTVYRSQTYAGYMQAWQDVTHNNMSYYFTDVLQGLTAERAAEIANSDYPMFVPVSSVYQTGRSYTYDGEKKYITTMQPYVIPFGEDFSIDLNQYSAPGGMYASGSIVLPDGFTYSVKEVSQPEYGTITKTDEKGVYTYTPDPDHLDSGKIIVTLSITKNDGAFKVDDVDLVLGFKQSHEKTKYLLERTTYLYNGETTYENATDAFEAGYAGYSKKIETDNVNPTQNSNTDIWYTQKFDPEKEGDNAYFPGENAVAEVRGKIYIDETAKYRIAIRGRYNVALYVSLNDENDFKLAGKFVQTGTNYNFQPNNPETYSDFELEAGDWLHFKAVMLCQDKGRTSFIGVGFGKFTPELGSYDEDGNLVDYHPESVSIGYATGYRESFEFIDDDFETDYMYKRTFKYGYADNRIASDSQTLVSTNYSSRTSWNINNFPVKNLTDGNKGTYIHSRGIPSDGLQILMDMGEARPVNRMTIYSQNRPNGDWQIPKDFTLHGSNDGNDFFLVGEFTDVPRTGASCVVNFEEKTFRYYKLVITKSHSSHIIIGEIEMMRAFEISGGNQLSPDSEELTFRGGWRAEYTASNFGHVYVGGNGATLSFKFTGTRIALLSSRDFGKNFEVTIDGVRQNSISLKEDNGEFVAAYISEKLASGEHEVTVRCAGEGNIDSVVTFDEQE